MGNNRSKKKWGGSTLSEHFKESHASYTVFLIDLHALCTHVCNLLGCLFGQHRRCAQNTRKVFHCIRDCCLTPTLLQVGSSVRRVLWRWRRRRLQMVGCRVSHTCSSSVATKILHVLMHEQWRQDSITTRFNTIKIILVIKSLLPHDL